MFIMGLRKNETKVNSGDTGYNLKKNYCKRDFAAISISVCKTHSNCKKAIIPEFSFCEFV